MSLIETWEINVTPVLSPSPLLISMEPRDKLNIPCDCSSFKGSGIFNVSLAFAVIIPCNSVLERNKIRIHDYKTISHCTYILLMKKYYCFTRTPSGF